MSALAMPSESVKMLEVTGILKLQRSADGLVHTDEVTGSNPVSPILPDDLLMNCEVIVAPPQRVLGAQTAERFP
jgi:hypothetical protein